MATFQQRRDPMRVLVRRIVAIVLLLLLAILVRGVWGVYEKALESRQLKLEAEARQMDLETREQELRKDIANLKSDRGLEAELRERYELAKEGESVVVIVEPPPPEPAPRETPFQRFKTWISW